MMIQPKFIIHEAPNWIRFHIRSFRHKRFNGTKLPCSLWKGFLKFCISIANTHKKVFFPSAWTLTRFFWSLKLTEIYRDLKKDAYWLRSRMWHIFKLFLCIQRFLLIFVKKNNYNPSLACRVFIASDKMLLIFSPDIQTVEITLYKEKKD